MHIAKTPEVLKPLARDLIWDLRSSEREVFLTFDDGPIPEVTTDVLDILDAYKVKATFFCVGANVEKHPDVYRDVLARGHLTGNHTWSHNNGWKTPHFTYLKSALQCSSLVESKLFRPPYGRIRRKQVEALKDRYHIVMWDVLAGDWDANRSPQQCLNDLIKHTAPGSVVVLHDSLKARPRVLQCLPAYLDFLKAEGYACSLLTEEKINANRTS